MTMSINLPDEAYHVEVRVLLIIFAMWDMIFPNISMKWSREPRRTLKGKNLLYGDNAKKNFLRPLKNDPGN